MSARATTARGPTTPRRESSRKGAKRAKKKAAPAPEPRGDGEPMRVLALERPGEAPLLPALAGLGPWEVTSAPSGSIEEAIAALNRQAWDVVLCAVPLAGLDSAAAARAILHEHGNAPLVLVGPMQADAAEALLAEGAEAWLETWESMHLRRVLLRCAREVAERTGRRRAEAASRESETRFAAFMKHGPTVAFLKDEEGRYLWANPPFEERFGLEPEAWSDRTNFDLWAPEVAAELHRHDLAVLARRRTSQEFEKIPGPDGREHEWMLFRFPVTDPGGRVLLGGLGLEVTELRQTERALQATQQRLERVLSSSPTVLYALEVDGANLTLVWSSRNLTDLLGWSVDEAMEPSWWNDTLHPEDAPRAWAGLAQLFRDDHLTQEYRLRHKKGHYLWIRDDLRLRRDPYGQPVEAFGSWADITEPRAAQDVLERAKAELEQRVSERTALLTETAERLQVELTERQRVEQASRGLEDRLRIIAQTTNDAIWEWDLASGAVWWNQGMQTLFRYAAADVAPTSAWWMERLHPEDRDRVRQSLEEVWKGGGTSWSAEYRFRRADGAYTYVLSRGHVERDAVSAAPLKMVGSLIDINELKRIEQALYDKSDELQFKLAELEQRRAELEQRNREMEELRELNEFLQACSEGDQAYDVIRSRADKLFGGASGALYIPRSARLLEAVSVWGDEPPEGAFEARECWALQRGRPHIAEGPAGLRCPHVKGGAGTSHICIPMSVQNEPLGLLHLVFSGDGQQGRWQFAQTAAENLAMGLHNLRLREQLRSQAIRDALTGLFNRRFMEEALEREVRRAARSRSGLAVVMIDIDHFKRLNDTAGHEAGDAVLREMGSFLRTSVRSGDIACRYGGEEMTLILPEASLEAARAKAEDLRAGAAALQISGVTVGPISISVGVAAFPDHGTTGDDLLRAADKALYRAKREGRNQVQVATDADASH